jgi:hypothetical protein
VLWAHIYVLKCAIFFLPQDFPCNWGNVISRCQSSIIVQESHHLPCGSHVVLNHAMLPRSLVQSGRHERAGTPLCLRGTCCILHPRLEKTRVVGASPFMPTPCTSHCKEHECQKVDESYMAELVKVGYSAVAGYADGDLLFGDHSVGV